MKNKMNNKHGAIMAFQSMVALALICLVLFGGCSLASSYFRYKGNAPDFGDVFKFVQESLDRPNSEMAFLFHKTKAYFFMNADSNDVTYYVNVVKSSDRSDTAKFVITRESSGCEVNTACFCECTVTPFIVEDEDDETLECSKIICSSLGDDIVVRTSKPSENINTMFYSLRTSLLRSKAYPEQKLMLVYDPNNEDYFSNFDTFMANEKKSQATKLLKQDLDELRTSSESCKASAQTEEEHKECIDIFFSSLLHEKNSNPQFKVLSNVDAFIESKEGSLAVSFHSTDFDYAIYLPYDIEQFTYYSTKINELGEIVLEQDPVVESFAKSNLLLDEEISFCTGDNSKYVITSYSTSNGKFSVSSLKQDGEIDCKV